MGGQGVDKERDERTRFLRVPTPIAAPRYARPHRAEKDAQAEEEERGKKQNGGGQSAQRAAKRTARGNQDEQEGQREEHIARRVSR